jgi:WD40 repeat protein
VRRLRATVAALTVLLLLATGLGGYATVQSRRLGQQLALAGARSLVGQAQQLANRRPDVAELLAVAAYRMTPTPDTVSAVTRLASRERQVDKIVVTGAGPVLAARFDPVDPNRLALYGPDAITIWDLTRAAPVRHWPSAGVIGRTAESPDGRAIPVQEENGDLVLWFPADDRTVRVSDADLRYDPNQLGMAFSPDGNEVAVCDPHRIRVWETATQRLRATVTDDQETCDIGFTATNQLATVHHGAVVVRNVDTNQVTAPAGPGPGTPPTDPGAGASLIVAPNGHSAIVETWGSGSPKMTVWDLDHLSPLGDVGDNQLGDVFFMPDGRQALVGYPPSVALVELASRRQVTVYSRDDGSYSSPPGPFYGGSQFSMSADGRRIALPAGGDTVAFLDTAGEASLPAAEGAAQVAAPADGPVVVLSVASSGEVTAQRSSGGAPVVVVPASPTPVDSSSQQRLSPDGRHVALLSGQQPDTVVVADITRPEGPATRLTSGGGDVAALAFDPAGGRLLAAADGSAVTVWSVDGTRHARVALKDGMRASGVTVSPDGTRVAVYDTAGNALLGNTASGETEPFPIRSVGAMSFSPDGRWLGVSTDTDLRIWDVALGRETRVRLPIDPSSPEVRFSPDGAYVAASRTLDGISRTSVWRVDDGALVGDVAGSASDVAFLPNGRRLVVAGSSGGAGSSDVSLAAFDAGSAVDRICRLMGRDLTAAERNQYARDLDNVSACP